jgi:hypothetical protein
MGSETLANLGGVSQVIATSTFPTSNALTAAQISAINHPTRPIRIQVNNGYVAYVLPLGFKKAM